MSYYIYGKVQNREVTFVGCTKSEIPADSILLQRVEDHPEVHWVKWSLRFRRSLGDKKALDNPFARFFTNPARLNRLLGDRDFERYAAEQNAAFLKFHEKNLPLLDLLISLALAKKAEDRTEYSMDQLLGEARWGEIEIDREDDPVKINANWSAWYSRAVQMVELRLVGFFAVRSSVADSLIWIDRRTWQQFASVHEDEINWRDPFAELPDTDWEYTE